jgi:bromodomain-containing protein 7/9
LERDAFSAPSITQFPSSLQEFVKDAGSYSKKMVDDLLDQITGGDHSRMIFQLKQVGFAVDEPF